jgi:ATP-dependent Clp protease ATP-binding subunit ClpA
VDGDRREHGRDQAGGAEALRPGRAGRAARRRRHRVRALPPRARRSIVIAQKEAHKLRSAQIGTEHLLLGLVSERKGLTARALKAQGVTEDRVRAAVAAAGAPASEQERPAGQIPFAPRAKKAIQLTVREALQLGHDYVGTEHLLLALFSEGEGVAADVLRELGVGEDAVREWVRDELLREAVS